MSLVLQRCGVKRGDYPWAIVALSPMVYNTMTMYLEKLEIHGFKSFAEKTTLAFLRPHGGTKGITAVVGPNGSGKSNAADAVRWVLGEQSIKMLRGKKSEDVIFSGSVKRSRLGMAEVALHLNNEDKAVPVDYTEIVLSRRLYRDGESEYLLNGNKVRLSDIQLLLAKARFAVKTYTVIGQGMIDQVLLSSPSERKELLDEAAGIREYELKRHQAELKLATSEDNLRQAEAVIAELGPRYRSLSRQMKRLSEREAVEKELHALQDQYYGALWRETAERCAALGGQRKEIDAKLRERKAKADAALNRLRGLEKEEKKESAFLVLQKEYETLTEERSTIREEILEARKEEELARIRAAKVGAEMPASAIAGDLEETLKAQQGALAKIESAKTLEEARGVVAHLQHAVERLKGILGKIRGERGAVKGREGDITKREERERELAGNIEAVRVKMEAETRREQEKKSAFFSLQRELQEAQGAVHALEVEMSAIAVELARAETRRDTLIEEMQREVGGRVEAIKAAQAQTYAERTQTHAELEPQILKCKRELEMIGGIDPEAQSEYGEVKERYEFLTGQVDDLRKTILELREGIAELDTLMRSRREEALVKVGKEFERYFQTLFRGGHAKLVPVYGVEDEEGGEEKDGEESETQRTVLRQSGGQSSRNPEKILTGIEVQATPPGKRLKSITMLSGGERALTSIALICAILSANPSPVVVLDEVDAALDESNSIRFAEILCELAERTQFVVITHNRATMMKAEVLYGVTMGEDGITKLLSVKLEDALASAREG